MCNKIKIKAREYFRFGFYEWSISISKIIIFRSYKIKSRWFYADVNACQVWSITVPRQDSRTDCVMFLTSITCCIVISVPAESRDSRSVSRPPYYPPSPLRVTDPFGFHKMLIDKFPTVRLAYGCTRIVRCGGRSYAMSRLYILMHSRSFFFEKALNWKFYSLRYRLKSKKSKEN